MNYIYPLLSFFEKNVISTCIPLILTLYIIAGLFKNKDTRNDALKVVVYILTIYTILDSIYLFTYLVQFTKNVKSEVFILNSLVILHGVWLYKVFKKSGVKIWLLSISSIIMTFKALYFEFIQIMIDIHRDFAPQQFEFKTQIINLSSLLTLQGFVFAVIIWLAVSLRKN